MSLAPKEQEKHLTNKHSHQTSIQMSPEARLAHIEIDSYNPQRDNLRDLFETPEGRTRQEHASYLNEVNQEARDLYERGATLYGNTLIIPHEANSLHENIKDKVRIGSLSYAAQEFASFIEEEKAKEKAAEFKELGENIAGRWADGDTLIVVFREFYNQIKRDERGRALSNSEKGDRLDVVLERMRVLSDAMLKEEPTRETVEILSLDDWERSGLESLREHDHEDRYSGRLSYRLEESFGLEFDERVAPERERTVEAFENLAFTNVSLNISYERIHLNDTLPKLPQNLSSDDKKRLLYEVIPQIDRAIENGVHPREIISSLWAKANTEIRKEKGALIASIITTRVPETNLEHSVTHDEEVRAYYSLQVLGVIGNEVVKEKGFSLVQRANAIDVVGTRLAQNYRELSGKLKSFSKFETEREELNLSAKEYAQSQRATKEFQKLLNSLREEERVSFLSEQYALSQGNNGRVKFEPSSKYSELSGKEYLPSVYVTQRQANEQIENKFRGSVQSLLVNPDIEKAQDANAQRLSEMMQYFNRVTNQEITNSNDARTALSPDLKQMRLALNALAKERSIIKIQRTLGNETLPKPIYVGLSSKSGPRLAVDNFNEYKTIENVASNLSIGIETYKGRFSEPVRVSYSLREQEINFAREYVNYRLMDETTRLKNTNRLFHEFSNRLNNARTSEDLRETIKAIRKENYAREKYPGRFANENETIKRSSSSREEPRRPLNEIELKKLLLSLPPSHYTEEMRAIRHEFSLTKREKAERVKDMESGSRAPSSVLKSLLSEFERTKSNNPLQEMRNIKAFLADYMNPPSNERNRFSGHNLFELRQKLSPTESNYLFKVIERAKQSVTSDARSKQPEQDRKDRIQVSDVSPVLRLKDLRDRIEDRVSNYLISVVQASGIQTFEQKGEGTKHATMVSKIIKETFKENNLRIESLGLTEERISNVSSKLVEELPQALQRERGRQIGDTLERKQLPIFIGKNSRIVDDSSNREEIVRLKTQSEIEPLVNQKINSHEKERTKEATLNLSQAQDPSNPLMLKSTVSQPRPQDIVAKNQTQNERYILNR